LCYPRPLFRRNLCERLWGLEAFNSWWTKVKIRVLLVVGRVNIMHGEYLLLHSLSTAGVNNKKRKRLLHMQAVRPYQPSRLRPSKNMALS
jgi:hypothetical protein